MRARLVGSGPETSDVELSLELAGLELDAASVIPVAVRTRDGARQVGTLRAAGPGRWFESCWVVPASLAWDAAALADPALRRDGPLLVSLGLGRSLRAIGRVDLATPRPLPLRAGGRWVLAPSRSGRVQLIPGRALRRRAALLVRRARPPATA